MRRFVSSVVRRPAARIVAVDHEAVQVDWLPSGDEIRVTVDGDLVATAAPGGAGAVTVPFRRSDGATVTVRAGGETLLDEHVSPLTPPPGAELCRFATISDLHYGAAGFDHQDRMREEPVPDEPHWRRCTEAALREIEAWGAERVVVKGDVTHGGRRDAWALAAETFATTTLPLHGIPGNHDTFPRVGRVDPYRAVDPGLLPVAPWTSTVDVAGLRIILCNTSIPHRGRGRLGHLLPALTDLAADARRDGRGVVLAGHHHVNPHPVPVFWPIGVAKDDGERTLATVRRANPSVIYTAGHTHRYRRRDVGGVPHIEVGSPKDHPGAWAGYVVFEGGILQTVHRVERPDCIRWTDQTRAAALGTWGHWSPGLLDDRCFAIGWPGAGG